MVVVQHRHIKSRVKKRINKVGTVWRFPNLLWDNITIFERKVINGKLILKVMYEGDEHWLVLEDQLELSRDPEIERSGYEREYAYYFK